MKKLLTLMLAVLSCGAAYALPTGNPADPLLTPNGLFWDDCWDNDSCDYDPCDPCGFNWDVSLRIGYYGDFVFNRKLQLDGFDESQLKRVQLFTNAGLIVLNFWETLDIYGILGATNVNINAGSALFGIDTTAGGIVNIFTDSDFSWTVGARAVLWDWGCTVLGIDARYFRTNPNVRRITLNETFTSAPDDSLELRYHEWQVSLALSHRINVFVPYVAVKWNKADVDFDGAPITITGIVPPFIPRDLENRRQWGYAVGVSLVDCDIFTVNVEGRYVDEKAIAVNAQVRF